MAMAAPIGWRKSGDRGVCTFKAQLPWRTTYAIVVLNRIVYGRCCRAPAYERLDRVQAKLWARILVGLLCTWNKDTLGKL